MEGRKWFLRQRRVFRMVHILRGCCTCWEQVCNPWRSAPRTPHICVSVHLDGSKGVNGVWDWFGQNLPSPQDLTLASPACPLLISYLAFCTLSKHHCILPFCFYPPMNPSLDDVDFSRSTALSSHLFQEVSFGEFPLCSHSTLWTPRSLIHLFTQQLSIEFLSCASHWRYKDGCDMALVPN